MEAFTPFIPLNSNDSGIPGAIIRYKVKNTSDKPVKVSVIGSLANAVGHRALPCSAICRLTPIPNEYRDDRRSKGLYYYTDVEESSLNTVVWPL